jgi:uncharacterized membrane protein
MIFMGDSPFASVLFLVGILATVAAIFLMSNAIRKQNIRVAAYGVSGLLAIVMITMIVMRDILRDAYLEPYFHPHQFAVKTQWAVLPVFLVLFIAGVGLWLLMLQRYGLFSSNKPPLADATPTADAAAETEVELVH